MSASGSGKGLGRSNSSSLPPRFPKPRLPRKNSDVHGLGLRRSSIQGSASNQRYERLGDRFSPQDLNEAGTSSKCTADQVVESEGCGKLDDGFERLGDRYTFPEQHCSMAHTTIDSGSNAHHQLETDGFQGKSSNAATRGDVETIDFSEISKEKSNHRRQDRKEPREKAPDTDLTKRKSFGNYFLRAFKAIPRVRRTADHSEDEEIIPRPSRLAMNSRNRLDRRQTVAPSQYRERGAMGRGSFSGNFEGGRIPRLGRQSMCNRTASQSSAGRSKSVGKRTSRSYSDFDVSEPELQRSNSQIDLQTMQKMLEAAKYELEAFEKEVEAQVLRNEAEKMRNNRYSHVSRVRGNHHQMDKATTAADIAKAIHSHTAEPAGSSSSGIIPRNKKVTEPKPFKLGGMRFHERTQKRKEEKKKQDEEEMRRFGKFKARPLPSFYKKAPK